MENKTIRVWDLNISSCWNCKLHERNDYDEVCCAETYTKLSENDINDDCPFSKPLSKEDIESCGFRNIIDLENTKQIPPTLTFAPSRTYIKDKFELKFLGDGYVSIYRKDDPIFKGTINNLQEFKLLLKQLNIE